MAVTSIHFPRVQGHRQVGKVMKLVDDRSKVVIVLGVIAAYIVFAFLPHVPDLILAAPLSILYFVFHVPSSGDGPPPIPGTLPTP